MRRRGFGVDRDGGMLMLLGRKNGKIKIKTDGTAGPRVVSCGCCSDCGYDAFSPTPIVSAQKFKYLTQEVSIPAYSVGQIDLGRQPYSYECFFDGESEPNCIRYQNFQSQQSQSSQSKITQHYARPDCTAVVIRAEGYESRASLGMNAIMYCDPLYANWPVDCWETPTFGSWNAEIEDAEWSTWQDPETGKLYLNQLTKAAVWKGVDQTGAQSTIPLGRGFELILGDCIRGYGGQIKCAPDVPSWQFSDPIVVEGEEEGEGSSGYKVRMRYDPILVDTFGPIPRETVNAGMVMTRQTLHNTLAEIWGPNQLEMRP